MIVGLVMIAVLPVLILTPLLIWRYRYEGNATYRPQWGFLWGLEVLIWGVPLLIVAPLAVLLWLNTANLDPWQPIDGAEAPLRIQVVGYDWKWLFIYPDQGVATVGYMVIPAGTPLAFELTSQTVMQSFWIPTLGGQVYAMGAGMVTRLHLLADGPGVFRGLNTQYNGKGFAEQRFEARAVSLDGFEDWVASVRTQGAALDEGALSALAEKNTKQELVALIPGATGEAVLFHSVPEDFFSDLVQRASASAAEHGR
ncbi:MAG: cytochrome ubiquinol oxidase subunit II [Natronospirillum sp.]